MSKHKIYQTILSPHYATNAVKKDGTVVRCVFAGATKIGSLWLMGKFGTSDPEVQADLEKSPSFGRKYKLIHEAEIGGEPVEVPAQEPQAIPGPGPVDEPAAEILPGGGELPDPEPTEEPVAEESAKEEVPAEKPEKLVCDATTVQEAKEFLLEHFEGATHRGLQNKAMIIQFAIENNVELINIK